MGAMYSDCCIPLACSDGIGTSCASAYVCLNMYTLRTSVFSSINSFITRLKILKVFPFCSLNQ